MSLSNLKPAAGSRKDRKRRGRGPGSGLGKTAGRGHKGQLAGSGYSRKRGFEGGQMPLARRLPKRGFNNIFRTEYVVVNLENLNRIEAEKVGPEEMLQAGLLKNAKDRVKVLGEGDILSAKVVQAHKFSKSAVQKIEAKGGQAVTIGKE
jgi:large subunit ribosomal protein L15